MSAQSVFCHEPVQVTQGYVSDKIFFIGSPKVASLRGFNVPSLPGEPKCMLMDDLKVYKEYRGNGLGRRLIYALAQTAIAGDCEVLAAEVASQYSLSILRTLFPEDSLTYTDVDPKTGMCRVLPITSDQAIQSLERAQRFEKNLEFRTIYLHLAINLEGIQLLDEPALAIAQAT